MSDPQNPNPRPKHFIAMLVLAMLIFLALSVVFTINYVNNQSKSVVEIMEKNYSIYVSGLAALFIIIFYLFFWTYRKLLAMLTVLLFVITYFNISYLADNNAEGYTMTDSITFNNVFPPEDEIKLTFKIKNDSTYILFFDSETDSSFAKLLPDSVSHSFRNWAKINLSNTAFTK